VENNRGSFRKPADAFGYYVRYTDAATGNRLAVPASEDFGLFARPRATRSLPRVVR
jgi:hypothetical protein